MNKTSLAEKARTAAEKLSVKYPHADIELKFSNPLELLVATVLSAQCTDIRVNQVTAKLFHKYHSPEDYLEVPEEELQQDIRSAGFFKQKTKSIRGIMQALLARHNGEVPASLAELTALPGVGRKTANVILGNAFETPGMVVDTHVRRVSQRIGLTKHNDPEKIEQDLMRLFPRQDWTRLSHVLIFHGRYTCAARKPKCAQCPLTGCCNYFAQTTSP
jgi:endonuclease-3